MPLQVTPERVLRMAAWGVPWSRANGIRGRNRRARLTAQGCQPSSRSLAVTALIERFPYTLHLTCNT